MVKRYFQDIDIACWVHAGKLGLSEPSVCLCRAAPEPCGTILRALEELEADRPPSKRTLTFKSSREAKNLSTLRLRLVTESKPLRVMNISCGNDIVTIEMTLIGLKTVRDAIIAWRDGAEDFGISPEHSDLKTDQLGSQDLVSGALWFWGPIYAGP